MHPLGRVVDVSLQPAAACEMLRDAGQGGSHPPSAIETAARDALFEARDRCASWAPPASADLLAGFGGAAFPLLAAAYDAGSAPVREVPRWAEAVVAARTAREGAIAAFGDRTTRPVVRALVDALSPADSSEVGFSNLALAMIGTDALQPDCLARVLGAAAVTHPVQHLPDPSTLHDARRTVARWGPIRAERVLLDAAATADGLRVLLDTIRYARQMHGHGPAVLPNGLADLHDVYRSRMISAAEPPPREEPPPRPPRAAARDRRPHRPRRPPAPPGGPAGTPPPRRGSPNGRPP